VRKMNEISDHFFNGNNVAFAQKLGSSEANIRNYRSRIVPKVEFIVKMCHELEISYDWFFDDIGPMIKPKVPLIASERDYNYAKGRSSRVDKEDKMNALNTVIRAQESTIKAQQLTIESLQEVIELLKARVADDCIKVAH
jgi:transcriptional regulator with XRE-family HTH domain